MDYVTRMLGVFFGVIFNELINKSCAGYKSSHGGMGNGSETHIVGSEYR